MPREYFTCPLEAPADWYPGKPPEKRECPRCNGTGDDGRPVGICHDCDGHGWLTPDEIEELSNA